MKKYIAICGNNNSGITDKAKANVWAAEWLAKHPGATICHICEVIETAERAVPEITTKTFFCELDAPVAKAA